MAQANSGDIELDLSLVLGNIDSALQDLQKKVGESGKKAGDAVGKGITDGLSGSIGNIGNIIKNNIGKIIGITSVAGAGYALASSLKAGFNEALEEGVSVKRLEAQLLGVGITSSKVRDEILDFADSFKTISSISGESITDQFTIGTSAGLSIEQYKTAVKAAIGLSNATGNSFESTFEQIAKTVSGSAGRLAQTNSELRGLTETQLKNGEAIDILAGKYNSFLSGEITSAGGALTVLSESFSDVFKAFSLGITNSASFVAIVKTLSDYFFKLSEDIEGVSKNKDVFLPYINYGITFIDVVRRISGAFQIAIGSIQLFAGFAFNAISVPLTMINNLKTGIGGLIAATGELTNNKDLIQFGSELKYEGENIVEFMAKTKEGIYQLGRDSIRAGLDTLTGESSLIDEIKTNFDKNLAVINDMRSKLTDSGNATSTRSPFVAGETQAERDARRNEQGTQIQSPLSDIITEYESDGDRYKQVGNEVVSINDMSVEAFNRMREASIEAGRTIKSALVNSVVNGIGVMVNAMRSGANLFEAFGNFLMGTIGDLAINLGSVFLSSGIGMLALGNLNPALSIVAGLGLIAAGQLIKSVFSGKGSQSSSGSGASTASSAGSSGGGLVESQPTASQPVQERQVGQNINVEVQGNIFDLEATGKTIVTAINRAFETSDARIVQGAIQ